MSGSRFIHIRDLAPEKISLEKVDHIIWDLDGTLYELSSIKRKIARSILSPKVVANVLNFYRVEKQIQAQRDSNTFDLSTYESEYRRMQVFINSFLSEDMVLSKSQMLLQAARKANIRQTLISEYSLSNKLEILGLGSFFERSFSCVEHVGSWKPNPKTARFLAQELGELGTFLVIGDRYDTDGAMFSNLQNFL